MEVYDNLMNAYVMLMTC